MLEKRFLDTRFAVLICALAIAVVASFGAAAAFADEPAPQLQKTTENATKIGTDFFLLDACDIVTQDQADAYDEYARGVLDSYGIPVYVAFVPSLNGLTIREYAEKFYKYYGLGAGEDTSGILFVVAVGPREYVTVTHGKGIEYFTDYGISQLENDVVSYLSGDQWYRAAVAFEKDCDYLLNYYIQNDSHPYDNYTGNTPVGFGMELTEQLGIAAAIGFFIAFIVCLSLSRKMKNARRQTQADRYVSDRGLRVTAHSDRYIRTSRSVVKIEDDSGPRSFGGGGGSSVSIGGFGGSSGGHF